VDADQVVALAPAAGVVGVLLANVAPGGFELEVDVLLLKSRELCLRPTRRRGTSPARCTGPRGRRSRRNSAESPPATSDTCSGGTQTSMSRASRGSLRASPPPTRTLKPTASSLSSPSPSPSIDLYAGSNARSLMSPCPEPSADPVTDTFSTSGEVRVVVVSLERLVKVADHRPRLDDLLSVLAGDRVPDDVPPRVATRLLRRREAVRGELLEDRRHVREFDPVELDRLSSGEVGVRVAEDRVRPGPRAYSSAISPIVRSCPGSSTPFGVPIRIIKYPPVRSAGGTGPTI